MPKTRKWSILTYIAAHNNLEAMGRDSYRQIVNVGSTNDVAHGVLFDGHEGAARYVVGEQGLVSLQERLDAYDSGDAGSLIETATWFFSQYPAERYGLVLWSHGSGWEPSEIEDVAKEARPGVQMDADESRARARTPGSTALFRSTLREILKPDKPAERAILFDDGTGHSLDTLELAHVLERIADSVGQPLELLGMDACLMANLEVAYEVRKWVRYLVASEELVPGHSWPYAEIYGALRASADQTGAELAKCVVDQYVRFYKANPPGAGDVTKVALDLGRVEDLIRVTDCLASALRAEMSKVGDALWKAQQGARQRETNKGKRSPSKFDYHLWDVRSLAAGLVGCEAATVRQAATDAAQAMASGACGILAEAHAGPWFEGIGGVSAYLMPPKQQRVSPSYSKLAFAKDTQWDEMLRAYHEYFD